MIAMRNIPSYLDDMPQFLLIDMDEFLILSAGFGLGLISGHLTMILLISYIFMKVYRKVKDRQSPGFVRHALYWFGSFTSVDKKYSSLPNSFIRRIF